MGTSRRGMELQRHKEIIEIWLHTPGIPADANSQLLEMLGNVNREIHILMGCRDDLIDDRGPLAS